MNGYNQASNIAPPPMMPLPNAVNSLGYSVGQMESAILSLRDRLQGVMTPAAPMNQTGEKQQLAAMPPPVSPMVDEVAAQSRRIDSLAMSLNEMLARLET